MQVNLSDKKGLTGWRISLTSGWIISPYCHSLTLLENVHMSSGVGAEQQRPPDPTIRKHVPSGSCTWLLHSVPFLFQYLTVLWVSYRSSQCHCLALSVNIVVNAGSRNTCVLSPPSLNDESNPALLLQSKHYWQFSATAVWMSPGTKSRFGK